MNSNNNGNGGGNGGNYRNCVKRFENWNYCHTCGVDVSRTHKSANCPKQLIGHQYATQHKNNTMNGNGRPSHKNIIPSVVGKVCVDVLVQQRQAKRNAVNNQGQARGN